MGDAIDFYFEFASPYGYLASTQIERIGERFGREVRWHPVMLGAAFKETGMRPLMQIPLKGPYMMHDLPRFARLIGVPFTAPPVMPDNSLHASRATVWLDETAGQEAAKRFARAVFRAHWGEGRAIGKPELIAEIGEEQGIDRDALLEAIADPKVKERLKERTAASIERGVFGSPFVIVDGEPFWGADRLTQVETWLERGGW
ncbi:MAG: 2-hydroxychromene-2-carboxylate isomerase [Geminicoccaceae bacterium]|nr:2-hydroxychromene-2-carboxylate isomerase [Geminicoccaceae bacterium]